MKIKAEFKCMNMGSGRNVNLPINCGLISKPTNVYYKDFEGYDLDDCVQNGILWEQRQNDRNFDYLDKMLYIANYEVIDEGPMVGECT